MHTKPVCSSLQLLRMSGLNFRLIGHASHSGVVDYVSEPGTTGYDRALQLAGEISTSGTRACRPAFTLVLTIYMCSSAGSPRSKAGNISCT